MPLDNLVFPEPFKLSNRNPKELPQGAQRQAIANFQLAVFEGAKRAAGKLRPVLLPPGTTILRNVSEEHGLTGDQARTVPPNSSGNTSVRWSGLIEGTNISRGALYTSLDTKGLLNEAIRYKRETMTRNVVWAGSPTGEAKYTVFGPATHDYHKLLVGRVYYTFTLKQSVRVADLTPSAASDFYSMVESDRLYQAAKRDLRVVPELWKLAFDPVDYTGSRPLGLSVLLGNGAEGMQVESAQSEASGNGSSGTNVVLGGADGKLVEVLKPVGRLVAGTSQGHAALIEVGLEPGGIDPAIIMRGSILSTDPK